MSGFDNDRMALVNIDPFYLRQVYLTTGNLLELSRQIEHSGVWAARAASVD